MIKSRTYKDKTFTEMTKTELENLVISELVRIDKLGHGPTVKNYTKYKRDDAPQYPTIRALTDTPWVDLVKKSGLQPEDKVLVQRDWRFTSDEEMLEMAFGEMHKLDSVTYANYMDKASKEVPSLPTILSRLNVSWNELVEKYTLKYGDDNVRRNKTVRVPYKRYQELVNKEMVFDEMLKRANSLTEIAGRAAFGKFIKDNSMEDE